MYNLVQLIGRLTADPEMTDTENGKKVCKVNLAVQRGFKNSEGIYETDFIRCTLWDAIASRACEFCHKGDLVAIRGQIRTSNYTDQNDVKKYAVDIVVEKLLFLSTKSNQLEDTE